MKAIRMHAIGGPEVLRLDEIEVPEPGPGEVLVKVEACGVAYGDIMKRQGGFGQDMPLPCGLGLQVAGTVAALGPETSAPAPGARVMAGVSEGYADYVIAHAPAVTALPDAVDFRSAAALPVQGLTAYQTLHDAGGLRPGESVLVHAAAGGVGSLAVQLADLFGGGIVIGTASQPHKLEHIHRLGAKAVNYSDNDWPQQILEATAGRGVDLVLDSVGGRIASQSVGLLAEFGAMVSFGAAGGSPADVTTMPLMHNNLSIVGYSLGGWLSRPEPVGAAIEKLIGHLATGGITVPIGQAVPLEKAEEAHRVISERNIVGTTVLMP